MKSLEVDHISLQLSSLLRLFRKKISKMGWPTFWATFFQKTHLVTLLANQPERLFLDFWNHDCSQNSFSKLFLKQPVSENCFKRRSFATLVSYMNGPAG
jgi:hypothetical protein